MPIPVFPLVGSISTVSPGRIFPSRSAPSIIASPMRSFTLAIGLAHSIFATTRAPQPAVTRVNSTIGVPPISSVTFAAIFIVCPSLSPTREAYPFAERVRVTCATSPRTTPQSWVPHFIARTCAMSGM